MKKIMKGHGLVLSLTIAFVLLLALSRVAWTGRYRFVFLPWNLFLAGVPLMISVAMDRLRNNKPYQQWSLFLIWLLFFPNAPYLVTDLIHFNPEPGVPAWFDIILLFTGACAGLWMGYLSLPPVERLLTHRLGRSSMHLAMPLLMFLSAYGVFLGRVLRWNSWDVFVRPGAIIYDTAIRVRHPFHHLDTWGMTAILGIMLSLIYYALKTGRISEFAN